MIDLPEKKVERVIDGVIEREGGAAYTNNPDDAGGATRFGIAEATARAFGYTGRMQDLPLATARAIYRKQFVSDPGFDRIFAIDPDVGTKLIDAGVNLSPTRAATLLQRTLNSLNVGGSRYAVLKVDGAAGATTCQALRDFIAWRGQLGVNALLIGIRSLQGAYYIELTEAKPTQRQFAYGWLLNRVEI